MNNNNLDTVPSGASRQVTGHITCCYTNTTNRIQIVRVTNVLDGYLERAVFPQQQLIFHTLPEAMLEIHSSETITSIKTDQIPCTQIRLAEPIKLPRPGNPSGVVGQFDYR